MKNESEIIVGVVSGVLTSIIIFVIVKFFDNTVVPAFRKIVYRGIDVSGVWYWENRFGSLAQMEIRQFADRLDGTYTYLLRSSSNIKTYEIFGNIQDRFIQLTLRSKDRKRLGVLSYVFEVVGDGCELKGCSSYYSTNTHRVVSEQESFYRDPAIAKKRAQELQIETQKFLSSVSEKLTHSEEGKPAENSKKNKDA